MHNQGSSSNLSLFGPACIRARPACYARFLSLSQVLKVRQVGLVISYLDIPTDKPRSLSITNLDRDGDDQLECMLKYIQLVLSGTNLEL
jgi:hypothetical protein